MITNPKLTGFLEDHPSLEMRHLFEIAAVLMGCKPVVRVIVTRGEIPSAIAGLQSLGLVAHLSKWGLGVERGSSLGDRFTFHVERDDPRAESFALIAGKDDQVTRRAVTIEEDGDCIEAGRSLGYPDCCIAAYIPIEAGADWLAQILSARETHGATPHLVNKVAYLFDGYSLLPDYFPCSLSCRNAHTLAVSLRSSALACGLSDRIAETEERLRLPIAVWRGFVIQSRDPIPGDGLIRFDQGIQIVDWRPGTSRDLTTLKTCAGAVRSGDGVALLACDGSLIPGSFDAGGHILSFEG